MFSNGQSAVAAHIQFLYINAGEDSASGGHVALKIGEEVYHFQHVPPGLIRVKRDDYAQFRDQYTDRENRTILMHHVEVSENTINLLRERFNRILLIEDEQFSRLETLESDRVLLKALLQQSKKGEGQTDGVSRTQLMGLGLFLGDGWNYTETTPDNHSQPRESSIARLKLKIEAAYGSAFLAAKRNATLHSVKELSPNNALQADVFSEDQFLPADYSFSERYANYLTVLAALRVLELGLPLREGMLLRPQGVDFRLNQAETLGLEQYKALLENQLLELLRGNRRDWGFPLLLGMARLIALDESIASRHLVFLNLAEPRSADELGSVAVESRYADYSLIRAQFITAKSALADITPADEWSYNQLEKMANVYVELDQAIKNGRMARLEGMTVSMPSYHASMALILPTMTATQLQSNIEKLENRLANYQANMNDLYAYRLIGRNCATEIFRVIKLAMRESAKQNSLLGNQLSNQGMVEFESNRSLGGFISGYGAEFIPFLSFHIVGENWRVSSSETVSSYRIRRLDEYKALENPWLVDLRESNVFSSSLYHWHRSDSAFVFFTDDLIFARPLAGVFNFAAGLGQALFGVLTLPWYGGDNLLKGAKGTLLSLPELFFVNIRKGSFPENISLRE